LNQKKKAPKQSGGGGAGKKFYMVLALVVAAGLVWLISAGLSDSAGQPAAQPLPVDIEADAGAGIALGAEDAPVTIMEFADYSCPHCATFANFTGRLLRQNYVGGDGPVRWVLYDYVLGTFPNSMAASLAARCAGDQGQYWPMHDLLFARQARWSTERDPSGTLRDLADELDLDGGDFRACMSEERHLEPIVAVRKYGDELGINSTPSLFVNGRPVNLATEGTYEALEQLIRAGAAGGDSGS
jgi:protein-disulfide isomerase